MIHGTPMILKDGFANDQQPAPKTEEAEDFSSASWSLPKSFLPY
jgi:hypothetical protein